MFGSNNGGNRPLSGRSSATGGPPAQGFRYTRQEKEKKNTPLKMTKRTQFYVVGQRDNFLKAMQTHGKLISL
jgi:hypothetical protein